MFRIVPRLQATLWIRRNLSASASLASTEHVNPSHPNVPLDLDPSLESLLEDANMSLLEHQSKTHEYRELEATPAGLPADEDVFRDHELSVEDHRDSRKSPAASFGSYSIGAVALPFELQQSINRMILGTWKFILRCIFFMFILILQIQIGPSFTTMPRGYF
jgi:hypothetical protein